MPNINPLHLLIVEDSEADYRAAKRALEESGLVCKVSWTRRGEDALELLQAETFDVALIDSELPGISGLETLRQIAARGLDIPIIFTTEQGNEAAVVESIELGAQDFFIEDTAGEHLILPILVCKAYTQWGESQARKQAEEALREAELSYQTVADFTYDWEYWRGPDGEMLYTSPACERITGYTVEQFFETPQLLNELVLPEDREVLDQHRCGCDKGEVLGPQEIQFRIRRRDGETRWIEHVCQPVTDGQGNCLGYRASNRDITKRKQTEETLRKFSLVVEQSANIIVITDTEGNIEYVNPKFTQITGYTAEEAIGQTPRILKSGLTPPETYDELWKTITAGGEWLGEFLNRKKNGEPYWESTSISPIKNAQGEITHYLTIKEDITARKQTEEALREAELRYRTVADFTYDWEYWEGPDGEVLYTSPACERITGYTVEQFFETPQLLNELVLPEDREILNQHYYDKVEAPGPQEIQFRIRRRDGETRWIEHICRQVTDEQGKFLGYRASNHDITARKQAEKKRLAHLNYLQNIERINQIIVQTTDLEQMIEDAIKEILSIFDSDRAWLLYPCNPDAPRWRVPVEHTRPEYPGACALNEDIPMTPDIAKVLQATLDTKKPVVFDPSTDNPLPPAIDRFSVRSQMIVAVHPKIGEAWQLGMHQCSHARLWTAEEQRLFRDIGHRVSEALSNLLFFQNLQESEEKFRNVVEQSHDGILLLDEQGLIVEWNRSQEQITGLKRAEVLGSPIWETISRLLLEERNTPEVRERIKAGILTAFIRPALGTSQLMEQNIQHPDGERRSIQFTIFPIKTDAGFFTGSTVRDVTSRKQTTEALRASEEQLAQAQQLAHLGNWAWDILSDTITWSDELYRIYGLDPQEFIPSPSSFFERVHPDDLVSMIESLKSTMHTHEPTDYHRIVRPDGTIRTINSQRRVILDDLGNPVHMFGTAHDVTERKQAEEALRKHTERINLLYEAGKYIAQTLDLETIYSAANSIVSGVVDCASLFISSYDPDSKLIRCAAAWRSNKPIDVSEFPLIPLEPEGRGTQSLVIRSGEALYLADYQAHMKTAQTSYYVNEDGKITNTETVSDDADTTRSALIAPLKLEGQVVGVIQVFSYKRDAYTDDDLRFLQALASHVAAATANALLYQQAQQEIAERKRGENLQRIQRDIGIALSSTHDLTEAMKRLLGTIFQIEGIDSGGVYIVDPSTGELDLVAHDGLSPEFIKHASHYDADAPQAHLVMAGECIYRTHAEIVPEAETHKHETLRGMAIIPVKHKGQVVAVLNLASHTRDQIPSSTRHALETIAAQIGNAMARVRAEAALRKSEERYRSWYSMFRLMADNITDLLWAKDREGRFLFANKAVCEKLLVAEDTDEPIGKTDIYFANRENEAHPENPRWHTLGTTCINTDAAVLSDGKPKRSDEFGNVKGEFIFLDVHKAPFFDEQGEIIGTVGSGRVVTREKRIEAELRESERVLRSVFENMQDGFYRTDSQGHIIWGSPSTIRMAGYTSPEEMAGFNITDFYSRLEEREDFLDMLHKTGRVSDYEVEICRRDGSTFTASINAAFYRDENGEIAGIEGSLRDITTRKRAEERAWEFAIEQERSNVLQRFIGDASHDLKTPLTTIKTSLYILASPKATDQMRERHLETLGSQTARLEKLLEDMLNMSRLDEDIDLKCRPTDLNTLMQNIVTRYTLAAKQKEHTLEFFPQTNLPITLADGVQLYQAIGAIITNALNYTPEGGTVTMRTTAHIQTQQVIIEIQDTGMGITEADLPHIFKRFYRADKARSSERGGAGLGLALAKRIVEGHRGHIEVKSTPEKGSTFSIFLPIINTNKL